MALRGELHLSGWHNEKISEYVTNLSFLSETPKLRTWRESEMLLGIFKIVRMIYWVMTEQITVMVNNGHFMIDNWHFQLWL